MAPKAAFAERFPAYRGWLLRQLGRKEAKVGQKNADVGALEKAHGLLLEERFQPKQEVVALPTEDVSLLLDLERNN